MTRAARMVLDDCRVALAMLEEETDLQRWRVHWAAAVALCRAVGHVLDKVDGRDVAVKRAAAEAFARWKGDATDHEIFREFIEKERNSILKEYCFNINPSEEVWVVVAKTLQNLHTGEIKETANVYPIGENIYRPMLDGYRVGDDARDILADALIWWEGELGRIDMIAGASGGP